MLSKRLTKVCIILYRNMHHTESLHDTEQCAALRGKYFGGTFECSARMHTLLSLIEKEKCTKYTK